MFLSNSSLGSCQSWQHLQFSRAVWQLPGWKVVLHHLAQAQAVGSELSFCSHICCSAGTGAFLGHTQRGGNIFSLHSKQTRALRATMSLTKLPVLLVGRGNQRSSSNACLKLLFWGQKTPKCVCRNNTTKCIQALAGVQLTLDCSSRQPVPSFHINR